MYTYLGLEPLYIPGTCLPFILVVENLPNMVFYAFSNQNKASFVFRVMYIYIYYIIYFLLGSVIFTNHPENVADRSTSSKNLNQITFWDP